jgi:AcrR family transcriptional regulator
MRSGKTLLTREDWARAALGVIAESGVAGVRIDELAKRLEVTRGSFYWHYQSREELIKNALEVWARESTTDRLPELEEIADPVKRLRALLRSVYEAPADAAELMLSTSGDDPLVAPVFAQVTRRRMDALQRIFSGIGLVPSEAADRAWLAYAFYIGHHQLCKNPQVAAQRPTHLGRMAGLLTQRWSQ